MVNLDKLILAFNTRIQYHNKVLYQFEILQQKIEDIDKQNDLNDSDDFTESINTVIPYKFGNTTLEEVNLKEVKTQFKYNYWVVVNNIQIGLLQWETYGTKRNYGYMTLQNQTLYNGDWKLYKQALNDLNLTVNHISRLDIAYDSNINPTKRYLDIIKDKSNEIIINGYKITDRNILLHSPYFIVYGTLDEPLKYPQIHLMTKDKSTTVKCYNKSEEVEEKSKKNYIKDKYKSTHSVNHNDTEKDIFRCEVSLNVHTINRLLEEIIKENDLDVDDDSINIFLSKLEDNDYLLQIHKDALFRLFRYSKRGTKRKTLLSYYAF